MKLCEVAMSGSCVYHCVMQLYRMGWEGDYIYALCAHILYSGTPLNDHP